MILLRSVIFLGLAGAAVWYFLAEPDRRAELANLNRSLQAEAELRGDSLAAALEKFELATVLAARSTPVAALIEARSEPPEPAQPIPDGNVAADFGRSAAPPVVAPDEISEAQALDELRALADLTGLQALRILKEGAADTLPAIAPPADLLADGSWRAGIDAAFNGGLGQANFQDDQGRPVHVFFTPYLSKTGIPAVIIAEAPLDAEISAWGTSVYHLELRSSDGGVIFSNSVDAGRDAIEASQDIPALKAVVTVAAARPEPIGPWAVRSAAVMLIAFLALLAWEFFLARRRLSTEVIEARLAMSKRQDEVIVRTIAPDRDKDQIAAGENLALVGQVSDSIGQEINRPLSAIRTHAEAASRSIESGDMDIARDNIRHISSLADRIWRVLGNIRGFAVPQPYQIEPVSIRPLVHDAAVNILERDPALGDFFFMEEADDLPEKTFVRADKTRLIQVLDSLLSSCWDACREQEAPEMVISIRQSRDNVIVAIDYTGPGGGLVDQGRGRVAVGEVAESGGPLTASVSYSIAKSFVDGMGGRLLSKESALGGGRLEIVLPKFRTNIA